MSPSQLLRAAAAVTAAAVLLGSGTAWTAVRHYTEQIQHVDAFPTGHEASDADGITVLVVGSDSRAGLTTRQQRELHTGPDVFGQRTDTIMLIHLSRGGEISLVSIPRDSLLTVPAHTDADGTEREAATEKVNSAFAFGGPDLLIQTIEDSTGIGIDRYVEVDFAGFVAMVDALDGVDVCTPTSISDQPSGLELPAGRSTLDGAQALAFVRARYFDPTGDIGRVKRQQTFIASIVQEATSPAVVLNPGRLTSFVDALLSAVQMDDEMNREQVFFLARRFASVDPSKVTFRTVPIAGQTALDGVGSGVVWDPVGSEALFGALREDRPIPDKVAAPKVEVAPADIAVQLVGPEPIATRAADDFKMQGYAQAGWPIVTPAATGTPTVGESSSTVSPSASLGESTASPSAAASPSTGTTLVEYDPGYDVSVKTLQAALPDATFREVPGLGGTFRISVAEGYQAPRAVTVDDPTQPEKPRTAADDICQQPDPAEQQ